ncbi:MAG: hypothetical protein QME05_03535, partial [Candidatus Margulisbacteria bacterium]|nr:hypothetical protein [Candidatus Margulisiibacteriota bacterium]
MIASTLIARRQAPVPGALRPARTAGRTLFPTPGSRRPIDGVSLSRAARALRSERGSVKTSYVLLVASVAVTLALPFITGMLAPSIVLAGAALLAVTAKPLIFNQILKKPWVATILSAAGAAGLLAATGGNAIVPASTSLLLIPASFIVRRFSNWWTIKHTTFEQKEQFAQNLHRQRSSQRPAGHDIDAERGLKRTEKALLRYPEPIRQEIAVIVAAYEFLSDSPIIPIAHTNSNIAAINAQTAQITGQLAAVSGIGGSKQAAGNILDKLKLQQLELVALLFLVNTDKNISLNPNLPSILEALSTTQQ